MSNIEREVREKSSIVADDFTIANYLNNKNVIDEYRRIVFMSSNVTTQPKSYMEHDLFNSLYTTVKVVDKPTAWSTILRKITSSDEYLKLKRITNGSAELSAFATSKVLYSIISQMTKDIKDKLKKDGKQPSNADVSNMVDSLLSQPLGGSSGLAKSIVYDTIDAAKEAMKDAVGQLEEYKDQADKASQALIGMGGMGFSHEGISLMMHLKNPVEFRKRVRILQNAFYWLRRFSGMLPASLTRAQTASIFGDIAYIDKILRESEIQHLTSSELLYMKLSPLLGALRIVQREAMVNKPSASPRIVIFIDKSGSMAGTLENVEKISLASGLALAMLRKFQSVDVYLFDTEVTKANKGKIVDVLMTIMADGGTQISEVLRTIKRIDDRKSVYIVITDGIDEVPQDVIDELRDTKTRVFFILIETQARNWLSKNFKYATVFTVAQFTDAVMKVLRNAPVIAQ